CLGWLFGACACWGCWGALHRGGWGWAWVCRAWRADGGALCCGSGWCCGGPDVPQRGLGALARGWGFGGCGGRGPTGPGSRLPPWGWGDRGSAAAACERVAGCCCCARGSGGGYAACRLRCFGGGGGCGCGWGACACWGGATRLHGAVSDRCFVSFAADGEQGALARCGACAAGAGFGFAIGAQSAGGGAVRAVCGGIGTGARWDRRRLFCAWWSFAACDACDQPHSFEP